MLAILATHPIQYQAPAWRLLSSRGRVPFEVLYLTAHGVEPALDSGFGEVFRWDLDLLAGYPHRFPCEPPPSSLRGFWSTELPSVFREVMTGGRYSALLVPGWHVRACWEAVWLAHGLGIPIWTRGDSNDLKLEALPRRLAKRMLIGALFRRIDRFLYVGEATRRLFRSYGAPEPSLVRAPHSVDNARFGRQTAALRNTRRDLRRAWRIPDESFCVLFVGKFESQKRPADLLKALRLLETFDRTRRYHALFVGAGHLATTLRAEVRVAFDATATVVSPGASTSAAASFAGFLNQSEIPRAYAVADLLVLPSESETWGLVVNEALASGLPCVVSDACGCAEDLVVPLDPRLRFPVGNVEALARAIQHAAGNPPPAQAIAAIIERFDLTATVEAIERLWDELRG